jgi:Na+/H+-dicarboxylate symporter
LGVDRILDMSRTVVNVTGDIVLAGWIDTTEKNRKAEFA